MDIFDRLKQFIVTQNLTIASFERKIGVSNATIGKAIERKKGFTTDVLIKILETFLSLNPDWLLLGKGEMLRQNVQSTPQIDPLNMVSLEKYEQKVEECALLRAELKALKVQQEQQHRVIPYPIVEENPVAYRKASEV